MFVEEVTSLRSGLVLDSVRSEDSYSLLLDPRNRINAGFIVAAAPELRQTTKDINDPFEASREPGPANRLYDNAIANMFWAPKSVLRRGGDGGDVVDEDAAQYDVLVLGPWGCDASHSNPDMVADAFIRAIQDLKLLDKYKEIHFALGRILGVVLFWGDRTDGGCPRVLTRGAVPSSRSRSTD